MTIKKQSEVKIRARKIGDLFFEEYAFSPGKAESLPAHAHLEYQIGLAVDTCGRYEYRGSRLTAPQMTLSVIHSGAIHQPAKGNFLENFCRYRILYVSPEVLMESACEIGWRKSGELPFFPEFNISNAELTKKFINLYKNADSGCEKLTFDVAQTEFLDYLVRFFSQIGNNDKKIKTLPQAIKVAREYLDANFTRQISLAELAQVAGLSKYHFCRTFRETVGVSPHVYQNHLRLNQAKKLLAQKSSLADVAYEVGFYDQSHFGRHFKDFSGVTPRMYSHSAIFS
jgi:AraC-like DNA-binding protein